MAELVARGRHQPGGGRRPVRQRPHRGGQSQADLPQAGHPLPHGTGLEVPVPAVRIVRRDVPVTVSIGTGFGDSSGRCSSSLGIREIGTRAKGGIMSTKAGTLGFSERPALFTFWTVAVSALAASALILSAVALNVASRDVRSVTSVEGSGTREAASIGAHAVGRGQARGHAGPCARRGRSGPGVAAVGRRASSRPCGAVCSPETVPDPGTTHRCGTRASSRPWRAACSPGSSRGVRERQVEEASIRSPCRFPRGPSFDADAGRFGASSTAGG